MRPEPRERTYWFFTVLHQGVLKPDIPSLLLVASREEKAHRPSTPLIQIGTKAAYEAPETEISHVSDHPQAFHALRTHARLA